MTTPEGDLLGSRWDLDARVLLEEWDLVDPVGRIRVERLTADPDRYPVSVHRVDDGWIVAVGEASLLSVEELAANAASVSAVLEQRRIHRTDRNRHWQEAWTRVLAGAGDPEMLGWTEDQPLVVIAVGAGPRGRVTRPDAAWDRLVEHWSRALGELTAPEAPACLVEVPSGLRIVAPVLVVPAIDQVGARIVQEMAGARPFGVGVSRVCAGIADIPRAVEEADRALDLDRGRGDGRATYFHRIGLERLLARVPETDAADFATDMLGPLAADTTEAAGLRRTLDLLLETDFNIAETARRQFLHFTTVRYRVAMFEGWFGPIADDPARRVDLAVALMVVERTH